MKKFCFCSICTNSNCTNCNYCKEECQYHTCEEEDLTFYKNNEKDDTIYEK